MAAGFALAGVARPETIVGFLDVFGQWKPEVAVVMGTAVLVTFVSYRLILRRSAPVFETKFQIPTRRDVDTRLLAGSALFGLGWGLIGVCPGPALASIATGAPEVWVWLGSMAVGMAAGGLRPVASRQTRVCSRQSSL